VVGVERFLARNDAIRHYSELVETPHEPLVLGAPARAGWKSLAFCASGHFSS
jgi:hypothetical protein